MGLPVFSKEKIYKKTKLLSGIEVGVRPWTIGDKKDFLIQMELANGDKIETKKIMMVLVENCLENGKDINQMSNNDILQVLAELKRHAEGDTLDFSVNCPHCKAKNKDVQISISKDVKMKPFDAKPINLTDRISIIVRDLPEKERIELQKRFSDSETKFNFYFLVHSIKSVMDGDKIYNNFSEEEMAEWIDGIDDFKSFEKLGKELAQKRSSFVISKLIDCENCGKKINVYFDEPERFFVL